MKYLLSETPELFWNRNNRNKKFIRTDTVIQLAKSQTVTQSHAQKSNNYFLKLANARIAVLNEKCPVLVQCPRREGTGQHRQKFVHFMIKELSQI
jgi:hypothetical protein